MLCEKGASGANLKPGVDVIVISMQGVDVVARINSAR